MWPDVTKTENGDWGMGNGEWGMGNGEWGMGNGEYWSTVIPKKLSWSLRSTAKRRGLHVESERWKVLSISFPEFLELFSFCLSKLTNLICR